MYRPRRKKIKTLKLNYLETEKKSELQREEETIKEQANGKKHQLGNMR